jgi:hypothetical protein
MMEPGRVRDIAAGGGWTRSAKAGARKIVPIAVRLTLYFADGSGRGRVKMNPSAAARIGLINDHWLGFTELRGGVPGFGELRGRDGDRITPTNLSFITERNRSVPAVTTATRGYLLRVCQWKRHSDLFCNFPNI